MSIFFADEEDLAEGASADEFEELERGGGELGSGVFRGIVGIGDLDAEGARDGFRFYGA